MATIHRLKRSFTSGVISEIMSYRTDFKKLISGCKVLHNMICLSQGAVLRRSGFKFVYDLSSLGLDPAKTDVREIPFIFNKLQAYSLIFYYHDSGVPRVIFGTQDGQLLTYPDPPPTECPLGTPIDPPVNAGDVVYLDLPNTLNIAEFDWAQSADDVFISQRQTEPFKITRYDEFCWAVEVLSFISPPDSWQGPDGWPRKVSLHQQRLVYGGNILNRQTAWLSKAGDFYDFTPAAEDQLKADDAVTFTLDSGTQNRITWLISGKALFIGTMGNEWTVTGTNQAALTPDNILAQRQTNSGSEDIKPLMIGQAALFVERHGRTTNEFVYDYNYDGYKNADVSVLAPHLTEHYPIVDWAFQQVPHRVLWCIRSDGEIIALTYQREHKVLGWHTHDTEGTFQAITTIPGEEREDIVWAVVNREITGKARFYLEVMRPYFNGDEAEDGFFLDSHISYEVPLGDITSQDTTLTGLDHLEGKTVDVLVDGSVHPPRVVQNGEITLEYTVNNRVVVGLPYISEVRPYLPELELQDGTSLGRMQRIINVNIAFKDTLGAYIGRWDSEDGETIEELPFRVPTDLTGQAVPLFSGIYHLSFPEGYDREAEYFIQQRQPLPMTVLGVIDIIEANQ